MPSPKKPPPLEFDPQKLERLQEPITVTVQRLVNGQEEPVVLPTKGEEAVPGRGWTKNEVLGLDDFLARKWTGSGTYKIAAVGANGEVMKWKSYFPESRYEQLHMGQPVARPPAGVPAPGPMQQTQLGQPANGGGTGWLQSFPFPQPSPAPAPFPGNGGGQNWLSWQQAPPWYPQRQSAWQPPATPPPDDRVQAEREERLKLEAKIDRERLENAYKERLGDLGRQLEELKRAMSTPKGETEEVKLLRQELARAQEGAKDEKFTRLIDETNRQTRELIAQNQAQTLDLIRTLQGQIQQQPKGPDATMMLVIETMRTQSQAQSEAARAQVEAQKEIARLQAETQRESARNQLGPREMIDLMRSSSIGQEQLASAYSKVWELMQQGLETVLAAQGPAPNPALELVGQAAQGGLEVAQRYVAMKERSAVAAAQAQVATAQANANAARSAQAPPALAGAAVEDDEEEEEENEEIRETEEELFGSAVSRVHELRQAVADGALTPDQAARAVVGGISQMADMGIHAPILDLWAQGNLAALVESVLPDAPTSYQEQTIEAVFQIRNQMLAAHQAAQAASAQEAQR